MKKPLYIILPCLLVLALAVVGVTMWFFFGQSPGAPPGASIEDKKAVTIYDAQGNVLHSINSAAELYDAECWAYLELVLTETTEIIANQESCTLKQAQQQLFAQGYEIHTAFDRTAYEGLTAVKSRWNTSCNTACAITDLHGRLLAVDCADTSGKQINYTSERRSPYSSFKALSVYTPAVEKGVANWATRYQDAPYKQIADASGKLQDWPTNVTGTYSMQDLSVYDALRTSLNTVAVKCLADVGVSYSMHFLQDSFGIPLTQEEYVVEHYGEEEVIGNIALGYLESGITPVEMAGFYQIFATGGKYIPPKAVNTIKLKNGTVYFTQQYTPKQVISPGTADTMNRLLQGVVAPGGTGEMAYYDGVEIAGKTGTGDNYADNWFVGVTPGYSLAVWHGQHNTNQAEEMFAAVIDRLYKAQPDAPRTFPTHDNLQQLAYCIYSGKAFSSNCSLIEIGYFPSKYTLPVCDTCGKP